MKERAGEEVRRGEAARGKHGAAHAKTADLDEVTGRTSVSAVSKVGEIAKEAALVVLHGGDLGRRYLLAQPETAIGRSSRCDIRVDHESVSRRHAMLRREGLSVFLRDLKSTNGTLVNDQRVGAERELANGDLIKIGRTIFKFIAGGNIEQLYHEEIYRLTTIDGLTQAFNRRYFVEQLEREMGRCRRYGRKLAIGLFDVDSFKEVNDVFGHLGGDRVLAELVRVIQPRIRREDTLARIGGDEFALACPEITLPQAVRVGEKLRQAIAEHEFFFEGDRVPVSISVGLTEYRGSAADALELLDEADRKLYEAKRRGRNQVCG